MILPTCNLVIVKIIISQFKYLQNVVTIYFLWNIRKLFKYRTLMCISMNNLLWINYLVNKWIEISESIYNYFGLKLIFNIHWYKALFGYFLFEFHFMPIDMDVHLSLYLRIYLRCINSNFELSLRLELYWKNNTRFLNADESLHYCNQIAFKR